MAIKPWKRLRSRSLVRDPFLTLRADRVELPSGHVLDPYFVLEEAEWVHIFAADPRGHILLVKQYRYAAGVFCTEMPGGVVEKNETPLAAAMRELHEETGFKAERWRRLGFTWANPARQTNRVHLFVAEGLRRDGRAAPEASEDLRVAFKTPKQVKAMLRRGGFNHALQVASFYMALDFLNRSKP